MFFNTVSKTALHNLESEVMICSALAYGDVLMCTMILDKISVVSQSVKKRLS